MNDAQSLGVSPAVTIGPIRLGGRALLAPMSGVSDLARLLCDQLTAELKVPCVVENKGGAGGNVGAAAVASAAPDGYTFLVSAPGVLAYNKIIYRDMGFDPDKELDPICLYAWQPNVLVVNPELPVKSVAELIAYSKSNLGQCYSRGRQ